MPWFKVDDTLSSHPKARSAGLPAMGLWVVAGAYASQYLTEGFVPEWFVVSWPQGKKHAAALVAARLWSVVDGGWQFHQWQERQPAKDQVEADRAATRERQQRWRDKKKRDKGASNGASNGVTDGVTNAAPSRPVPSEGQSPSLEPRKRATRIPDDWQPTAELVAWQRGHGISDLLARRELPKFRDYWAAVGGERGRKVDWAATWRNWLRNTEEREPKTAERVHDPLSSAR